MTKVGFCFALFLLMFVGAGSAPASPIWLDEVIEFDQPRCSDDSGGPPTAALGQRDARGDETAYVSIDERETLIVSFSSSVLDGPGNDLRIYECGSGNSQVDIYASMDNESYVYLGWASENVEYDIADYSELESVEYLKFVGLGGTGCVPGFDLDAAQGRYSGVQPPVPIPGPLFLLASGLLWISGLRKGLKFTRAVDCLQGYRVSLASASTIILSDRKPKSGQRATQVY